MSHLPVLDYAWHPGNVQWTVMKKANFVLTPLNLNGGPSQAGIPMSYAIKTLLTDSSSLSPQTGAFSCFPKCAGGSWVTF